MHRSTVVVLAVLAVAVPALAATRLPIISWGGAADSVVVRSVRSALDSSSAAVGEGGRGTSVDSAVASFYRGSTAAPIWTEGRGPSRAARDLLDALRVLPREGLDPERFGRTALERALQEATGDPATVAQAELQAASVFMRVADALAHGALDGPEAGVTWEVERDPAPGAELLARVAEGEDPSELLDGLRPALPWYGALVDELARYRSLAEGRGWPSVPAGEPVEPGETATRVADVRARLQAGDDPREAELAARGAGTPELHDPDLVEAVERFQERHGIVRDGVIGPATVAAMNVPAGARIEQLRLNLDRLRRLPRQLGRRAVFVNVAGFELIVLEEDRPALTMDVVVGRPEDRTRVFTDEMESVVFHPYWMVPASIVREEIVPALRDDPSHLESNGFQVVAASDPLGAPVDPDGVDWSAAGSDGWPHVVRQDAGPGNALGQVKFLFPNEHAIYLHDTPADHLFQRTFRAFSHGCIRLERPLELARYLLRTSTDRAPSDVDSLVAAGERAVVGLERPVPVYIVYLTVWVDEDGTVRFHQDPYELDEGEAADVAGPVEGSRRAGPTR